MKVMNGLVMTQSRGRQEIFMCLAVLLCEQILPILERRSAAVKC